MRYYILNHELKHSQHGSEYYHVNICNEDLEEFHTYVYPSHNNKKIHNSTQWMEVLTCRGGVVLTNLTTKKGKPDLINADSIRNKNSEVDEIYNTKQDMYDHIHELLNPVTAFDELFN